MNNLVSVIVPTYGRPDNLKRAITSLLGQSYNLLEIIVVDDNDPKSEFRKVTEKTMEQYDSIESIVYIKHSKNMNGASARNTGIKKSKGNYIAFLDDDDEFLPTKIEKQVQFLDSYNEYDGCYCMSIYCKNSIETYKTSYCTSGDISLDVFSLNTEYNSSTLMFRKEALFKINGFDTSFQRNQDYEIMIRFLMCYKIGCLDEYLLKVHIDSRINEPPLEKYIEIRQKFLSKFETRIKDFSQKEQNILMQNVYFDYAFYAFKNKQFKKALYYLIKTKPSFNLIVQNKNKIKKVLQRFLK